MSYLSTKLYFVFLWSIVVLSDPAIVSVRRYAVVTKVPLAPFEEIQLDDIALLPSLTTFIAEALGDPSISKLVSLNGRPLSTLREVLACHEVIALSGLQRFYWPFLGRGHQHNARHLLELFKTWANNCVQLDGLELDRKEHITLTSLSDKPRVLLVGGLLSTEEADEIVGIAAPQMKRSSLVLHKTDDLAAHENIRTSTGRFVPNHEHPTIMLIAARVANLTRSSIEWAEDMQVIHYEPMQHYHAHYDYIDHAYDIVANRYPYDNRYVTVLFYLSDVEQGGGTVFPMTNPNWDSYKDGYGSKVCEESFDALRVKPKKGNAVIFYNMDEAEHPYGVKDLNSLHGGCDPLVGDKWAANYWIHNYYWHNSPPSDIPDHRKTPRGIGVSVDEPVSHMASTAHANALG